VYNWALDLKNQTYHDEGISLSKYDLMNQLPALKEKYPWLKEVNAQSLQQSIHHLSRAFTNFFEGRAEEPTFKKKHDPEQSFTVPQSYTVDFKGRSVRLPKISAIKTVFHRTFTGKMKSATVICRSTGRYFISIVVEDGQKPPTAADPIPDQTVGIDIGLSHYAVLSTGDAVANPKYLRNAQARLTVLQRRLARKQKGSKNRNKVRLKVARCHQKIADQRRDFQHQLSSRLVRENQALAVESLNVDGMVKSGRGAKRQAPLADNAPQRVVTQNHKLARAISDAGWGTFLSMLAYKCQNAGKTLLKIGVFEPSSKTCSICGYRKADLTLKDREWTCPDCGTTHDRDLNAAINVRNFALAGAEQRRRACGLAPAGEGDEAGSPLRKRGVVHRCIAKDLLGYASPSRHLDDTREAIAARLGEKDARLLVCLDDANYLIAAGTYNLLLYQLLRLYEGWEEIRGAVVFAVTSDLALNLYAEADASVRSVFRPAEVTFLPYTRAEIRDILADRARQGLYPGVVPPSVLDLVAEMAAGERDIRVGIALLRAAAVRAEKDGRFRVTRKDVLDIVATVRSPALAARTAALSSGERTLLYRLAEQSLAGGDMMAGAVFEVAQDYLAVGKTTYHARLRRLADAGIVDLLQTGKGYEVFLRYAPGDVFAACAYDGPAKG